MLLTGAYALSSCAGQAVDVDPPPAAPRTASVCAELSDRLPDTVLREEDRRATTPVSELTAAWGDPGIVLRCGVTRPAGLTPTSQILAVNHVDWLAEELPDGYRFTSIGRAAYVEVQVPDDYAPEVDPLVYLADAVKAAVPLT